MKRWLILLLACLTLTLTGCAAPCADDPACTRVLFIGNSYTFVNDLPAALTKLAEAGGQRLETGMAAQGGWRLADHRDSGETLRAIQDAQWKYIVLQEQSQIPASAQAWTTEMYPAAQSLVETIRATGATPLLFVTWAHLDGWPDNGLPTYEAMQLKINGGYLKLAQTLRTPLAPVGYAWLTAWRQNAQIPLWQPDNSHPTEMGTYLAACVFYTVLFRQSPAGLSYRGNLSKTEAELLQQIAAETVLNDAQKWQLP